MGAGQEVGHVTMARRSLCGHDLAEAFALRQVLAQHAGEHIMLDPSELVWKDLPSLPGVKVVVIEGPLDQKVPIMFRLKFPANFKVPPHWHPGIEHITIISGTLHMGLGSHFDQSKTRALGPGSIAIMQPGTHHFVWTNEESGDAAASRRRSRH